MGGKAGSGNDLCLSLSLLLLDYSCRNIWGRKSLGAKRKRKEEKNVTKLIMEYSNTWIRFFIAALNIHFFCVKELESGRNNRRKNKMKEREGEKIGRFYIQVKRKNSWIHIFQHQKNNPFQNRINFFCLFILHLFLLYPFLCYFSISLYNQRPFILQRWIFIALFILEYFFHSIAVLMKISW